jgi:hypothetical protein
VTLIFDAYEGRSRWGGPPQRVPSVSIVNARLVKVVAYGDTPLLDVLRNHLCLTRPAFRLWPRTMWGSHETVGLGCRV